MMCVQLGVEVKASQEVTNAWGSKTSAGILSVRNHLSGQLEEAQTEQERAAQTIQERILQQTISITADLEKVDGRLTRQETRQQGTEKTLAVVSCCACTSLKLNEACESIKLYKSWLMLFALCKCVHARTWSNGPAQPAAADEFVAKRRKILQIIGHLESLKIDVLALQETHWLGRRYPRS